MIKKNQEESRRRKRGLSSHRIDTLCHCLRIPDALLMTRTGLTPCCSVICPLPGRFPRVNYNQRFCNYKLAPFASTVKSRARRWWRWTQIWEETFSGEENPESASSEVNDDDPPPPRSVIGRKWIGVLVSARSVNALSLLMARGQLTDRQHEAARALPMSNLLSIVQFRTRGARGRQYIYERWVSTLIYNVKKKKPTTFVMFRVLHFFCGCCGSSVKKLQVAWQ